MKTKAASHSNRFLRIITVPVRALCKARDCYVKSMTNYAETMNYRSATGMAGAAGLPRSLSVNSTGRSCNDEDFRELVRAASARTTGDRFGLDSSNVRGNMMRLSSSRVGSRAMPPRSSSVAMGRIDEDRPCCYFGEDVNDNNVSVFSARNELKYPRSRSHAVTSRRLAAF